MTTAPYPDTSGYEMVATVKSAAHDLSALLGTLPSAFHCADGQKEVAHVEQLLMSDWRGLIGQLRPVVARLIASNEGLEIVSHDSQLQNAKRQPVTVRSFAILDSLGTSLATIESALSEAEAWLRKYSAFEMQAGGNDGLGKGPLIPTISDVVDRPRPSVSRRDRAQIMLQCAEVLQREYRGLFSGPALALDSLSQVERVLRSWKRKQAGNAAKAIAAEAHAAIGIHSPDYAVITVGEKAYTLTKSQATVVEVLHKNQRQGGAGMKAATVLRLAGYGKMRIRRDVFRRNLEAFDTLVDTSKRGIARLKVPLKGMEK